MKYGLTLQTIPVRLSLRGSGEPLPGGGAPPAHVQPAGAGRPAPSQAGKQGNVNNMKIGMIINLKMLTSGNAEPAIGGVESDAGGGRRRCRRSLGRRSRQEAGAASAAAAHARPRPAAAEAPTSRVAPAGLTPASAVQPPSSGGSSSTGAAAIHPVRRSSRTNVAFATPGELTSGSARGSSEHSSGTARAPSIRDIARNSSQSTGVRGNAKYQPGYHAALSQARDAAREEA